jgi:hypothetical protein
MTKQEVQELFAANQAMYEHTMRPLSDLAVSTQIVVWATALKDVPVQAGREALQRAFMVCKWPVTLAELCDQLRAMQEQNHTAAGALWDETLRAAREAVKNASRYPHTFREADGRTQGEIARANNKALFEAQHPFVKEWLGSVRQLIDLGYTANIEFKRKDFDRAYEEYKKKQPFTPSLLCPHTLPGAETPRLE